MKLLVIVLNKEEHLQDILSILVELGVSGATIVDSEGLGHFLAYQVPIFAGIRRFMGEEKAPSKTIFAIVDEEDFTSKLQEALEEENIDFTQSGMGVIFTVPVSDVIKPETELPEL